MKFKRDSWHYKMWDWSHADFTPNTSNLCPYCRTVFLWAPLKFLFVRGWIWKIPIPAIVYAFFAFEIPRWLGMISYEAKHAVYFLYGILIMLVASFAIGYAFVWFMKTQGIPVIGSWLDKLDDKRMRRLMNDSEWLTYIKGGKSTYYIPDHIKYRKAFPIRWAKAISSTLVWQYLKAKHEKVCPLIEFE